MIKIMSVRVGILCLVIWVASTPAHLFASESNSNEAVVTAANQFLATLTDEQRQQLVYSYDDQAQRARWSNFPTGIVARGGISFGHMTPTEKAAALRLLQTVLSPMGYEKIDQIRKADDDFRENGSKQGPPRGGPPLPGAGPGPSNARGQPPGDGGPGRRPPSGALLFGSDLYYISFLGQPSATKPWMLQFGGHHLALNITLSGGKGVMTPSLTGAQPATFKLNGATVRPLGLESDKALALLQSLDPGQRERAVLKFTVADLVLGPGQDGKRIAPEGLSAAAMNGQQKQLLLAVIAEWAGIMNKDAADERMAQLRTDLSETWFAWSGSTDQVSGTNITAYYRIQGPHLIIEYAPQHDEPANHVHTIYRDPTNDYGRSIN